MGSSSLLRQLQTAIHSTPSLSSCRSAFVVRLDFEEVPVQYTMAYQLYRNTTLGNSLQESLDELIQTQQITPQLALQVLLQFDKAINTALANRVRNRVNFRGSLNTYRFCDNVWTFVLNDVEFREVTDLVKVDKVKIVACDGKNTGSNAAE
ncbi:hypothetical protein DNTS_029059 [Danionella cerebrum]|nr:hypothetical protein DNTS_029059 [Danionella translucida]